MSAPWNIQALREIAEIRVSNVDKKTYANERPILLCNYMDVYSNEYITREIDFMEASATSAELDRFGLKTGDVLITKDSETPDDIGIPAVLTEDIPGLVCGYHLALIRPCTGIDPVYLSQQLSTSRVVRYFSLKASGSTRYGLPISAIESVEIPTPALPEQRKIAEILTTVDRAIEETEALVGKQQRIKTGLMQDLLTRGIDAHGQLRTEATHAFKDSPLGRIPVEWEVKQIKDVGLVVTGNTPSESAFADDYESVPFVTPADVGVTTAIQKTARSFGKTSATGVRMIPAGSICVVCIGSTIGKIGITDCASATNQQINSIIPNNPVVSAFLLQSMFLNLPAQLRKEAGLQAVPIVNKSTFEGLLIAVPSDPAEAIEIQNRLCCPAQTAESGTLTLAKLRSLKTALMQDLLTGRKRVTGLLGSGLQ